jgi:hypothetical protein
MAENTENKTKLEFFSDFKDKFFLILAGIISLATFIPAFLNKAAEIFGLDSINKGYYVFVGVYFVLPYIFYVLYCSIHDDVGYLELLPTDAISWLKQKKGLTTVVEMALPIVVFFYLIIPGVVFDSTLSFILCGTAIIIFIICLWVFRKDVPLLKEVGIIGIFIIPLFGLFFYNIISKDSKKENDLFGYTMNAQCSAFAAYASQQALKTDFVDSLDLIKRRTYHKYLEAALNSKTDGTITLNKIDHADADLANLWTDVYRVRTENQLSKAWLDLWAKDIKRDEDCVFRKENCLIAKNDPSAVSYTYFAAKYCYNLAEYAHVVQKIKTRATAARWAKLLKVLQYKSLAWFFFLIILGLCLWFKLQFKLRSITNPAHSQIPLLKDNVSQVKSFVFFLFILILPWFRTIDAKDVELDKPFLNFSLNNLFNGSFSSQELPVVPVKNDDGGDIDNRTINNVTNKLDSAMLASIDSNVSKSTKLIRDQVRDQAKRVIGSARDRNTLNH